MGKAAPVPTVESSPLLISLGLCLVIASLDWVLPAGIAVGMLLCVPILLVSASSRPADVWIVFAAATILFMAAAIFGSGPMTAPTVWLPNRVIALLTFPAAALLSRALQQQRLDAERTRDDAVSSGELNRLLFALLAHDLRSPLQLSRQMFDYIQETLALGGELDTELLRDVRARLDRNLRSVDGVLAAARSYLPAGHNEERLASRRVSIADEIRQEVLSFEREAELRNKRIVMDLSEAEDPTDSIDALVLRQVLAIALDNAIRYANRGAVHVLARSAGSMLLLRVEDPGPGIQATARLDPLRAQRGGAGLGLQLCEILLARAGGGMRVEDRNGKGCVEAWLPIVSRSESAEASLQPALETPN